MQERRGEDEADAELQGSGAAQFAAMGMAVEEGEDADDGGRCGDRKARRHGDQQAERHDGGEDGRLHEGQSQAGDGASITESHGADEGCRHGPERRTAAGARGDLAGPQADRDHGEDMVCAEQRMRDAGHEGAVRLRVKMGKRGCGSGRGHDGGKRKSSEHGIPSICLQPPKRRSVRIRRR